MRRIVLLCLLGAPLICSCEAFWAPLEELSHESPVVSVPSGVGSAVGGAAGIPVMVAALPITVPVAIGVEEPLVPLVPMLAVANLGALAIGGPFWLLFGWWT